MRAPDDLPASHVSVRTSRVETFLARGVTRARWPVRDATHPIGWPSATAPPAMLTLAGSKPRIWWYAVRAPENAVPLGVSGPRAAAQTRVDAACTFSLARTTTEKASLISCRLMSCVVTPAILSARGTDLDGEVGKSLGF